ncbi:G2/mitotic-specific cyclin 2, partial [Lecanoromycetidae sp. Uapishka_2]
MPPARSIRQRPVNNENDENAGSTRVTRAKAAALTVPDDIAGVKKALASKKSTSNIPQSNAAPGQRKRAALGDVSNVTKSELVDSKDGKKTLSGKAGLVSKAAQSAGIQKPSRTNSTRSVLGAKDNNKKPASSELKRPASGSGVMGGAAKKRHTGSTGSQQSIREEKADVENEPPQKKATSIETEHVKIETKKEVSLDEPKQEAEVKQAFAEGVQDLDLEDYDDPLMVAEYVGEIFEYLQVLEEATMPNPDYMDHQDHLEWHLRGVLIDWLIEVHTRFHLLPETAFLAVNIIDRFLSARVVELEKLQLVGVTAMFIASKYEEVLSPHVQNFQHVADDGFTVDEILKAERFVLQALNYDLSYPNPMNFLRRISKADNYDIQTRTIGKYLLEISLLDHNFMGYHPSHIAAASIQDATLTHYSGYTEEDIQPVFKLMVDYLHKPVVHEAFFKKYASKKFLKGLSFVILNA